MFAISCGSIGTERSTPSITAGLDGGEVRAEQDELR